MMIPMTPAAIMTMVTVTAETADIATAVQMIPVTTEAAEKNLTNKNKKSGRGCCVYNTASPVPYKGGILWILIQ